MDADALDYNAMTNASFYQHFPLAKHYPQNKRPTIADLKSKGFIRPDGSVAPHSYVTFYMGDYDSAAWFSIMVPGLWSDPARGSIPCSWAFNPNLDRRAPHALHFARKYQTAKDWFMFGDSGAGYEAAPEQEAADGGNGPVVLRLFGGASGGQFNDLRWTGCL